jgi:hypothetical protein
MPIQSQETAQEPTTVKPRRDRKNLGGAGWQGCRRSISVLSQESGELDQFGSSLFR